MGVRRVVYHDRRARPSADLEWSAHGALVTATVRIPDGSSIRIEPRAGVEAPWGAVDRLWADATPLTVCRAVAWERPDVIPPLAEPARLPPGAATAVLNLLAILARERGVEHLRYDGPYPTEALFLALLECFHPERADGDPLARFMAGELRWLPAPFTPCFDDDVYVQSRARIEKIVWRGRTYYREDWGGVRRWAPLRVDDAGGGVRGALWGLGGPLEEHVRLTGDGIITAVLAPPVAETPPRPVSPAMTAGLVAIVIAMSAAPLAASLREVCAALPFTVGPVERDLARVDAAEARVSETLAGALAATLGATAAKERRAETALAALVEIATALGDGLRAQAQARLAAAAPAIQAAALAHDRGGEDDAATARTITGAVAALLASGRVDDEPDVEGGERRDRHD